MAEVVGTAILSAVAIEASATVATVVGSVVITGALVGASYAAQSLLAQKPKREAQQATLNDSMGSRRFIYGRAMVGGTRAFWDSRNGMLFQCIMLAGHEIDGIAEYWIGDQKVETDGGEAGGNVQTFPMINAIFFERYLGTADQGAPLILTTNFGDVWSAAHRLRGIAHVCVVFKGVRKDDIQKVYPQGANTNLRFVVRGKKLYDPSIGGMDPENPATWAWGDNSADVILDYLRSPDGYRRPLARIDMPSFADFHAGCAENVPRADGSPCPRYRTWGTIGFDEEPQAALARLCSTCDATLYQGPGGKIGIRDGAWAGPLINISTQHIVGASLTQGNDKLDSYNRLKVSYTDPDNYYQATEMTARDDLSSQAAIGVIEEVRDYVMVPDWTQAARLAKIAMAKDNPRWRGSLSTDLMPLDAIGEKAVDIVFDPLGSGDEPLMNAPCEITAFTLKGDVSGCELGFRSVPASAWSWDADVEEPPRPATPASIPRLNEIGAPTGLDALVDRSNVSGNIAGVRLGLVWTASGRADVEAEAEYANSGSGGWQPMAVNADGASAWTPILADGGSYDMRVRFIAGYGGYASEWSQIGPTVAVADDVITGPPTGFVANGAPGQAFLAWTSPGESNLGSVRVYRAEAGEGFADAIALVTVNLSPNQAFDMIDGALAAGGYLYWVRALNRSGLGDASSTAGPVAATVS